MTKSNPDQIEYCLQRIAEEEAISLRARSPEAVESHQQMAMLYRIQLELLKTGRGQPGD